MSESTMRNRRIFYGLGEFIRQMDMIGGRRVADRGIPKVASPAVARQILQRLQELSAPYGTQIRIEGNVGIIRP